MGARSRNRQFRANSVFSRSGLILVNQFHTQARLTLSHSAIQTSLPLPACCPGSFLCRPYLLGAKFLARFVCTSGSDSDWARDSLRQGRIRGHQNASRHDRVDRGCQQTTCVRLKFPKQKSFPVVAGRRTSNRAVRHATDERCKSMEQHLHFAAIKEGQAITVAMTALTDSRE